MESQAPRILMCPPDHYAVRYVINPWMRSRRKVDPARAHAQWEALRETLVSLGARVLTVPPHPDLPDMVFTANAGLPVGDTVFLSRFRHVQRRAEARLFGSWFRARGFDVVELPPGLFFEGAGDALFLGDVLFAGYRFRSDVGAHTFLAERLGIRVLSLELTDRRFYHLDTCFAPLGLETALYYPRALDRYGRRVVEANVPDPVSVPKAEALSFACNAVALGRHVILHRGAPKTRRRLEARGFQVHELDLSEFLKAGGSAKCLCLELDRAVNEVPRP